MKRAAVPSETGSVWTRNLGRSGKWSSNVKDERSNSGGRGSDTDTSETTFGSGKSGELHPSPIISFAATPSIVDPACTPCNPFANVSRSSKWEDEDEANRLIVKELNELSFQERDHLFEDIHGVADEVKETESFLNERLESMATTVRWIREKDAYALAHFMSPEFVEDRALRLAILRSSDYNPNMAAKRIVAHFEMKLRLFGVDKIVKKIAQEDLTPGMLLDLEGGVAQIMPYRDRVGRPIVFLALKYAAFESWRSHYGMLWYIYDVVSRDEDAQKKGIVFVQWILDIGTIHRNLYPILQKSQFFDGSLAARAAVLHLAYNDPRLRPAVSFFQSAVNKDRRLRIRGHFGSHLEVEYRLMSYGINKIMLPLTELGEVDFPRGAQYLKVLREKEEAEKTNAKDTVKVTSRCVVIGKGYPFQNFPGNIFFSELVDRNRERYASLEKRLDKTMMARSVIEYIETVHGGRFLKRASAGRDKAPPVEGPDRWVVATDKEAKEKVSFAFRGPKRRGIEYSHESEKYPISDNGHFLFIPPQVRIEEWKRGLVPEWK